MGANNRCWEVELDSHGNMVLEHANDNNFALDRDAIKVVSLNAALPDEEVHYAEKAYAFHNAVTEALQTDGEGTRRAYKAWDSVPGENLHCITMMQLLVRPSRTVMSVYFRSSDFGRFPSDVGFVARIAQEFDADWLEITVGSWHVYLTPPSHMTEEQDCCGGEPRMDETCHACGCSGRSPRICQKHTRS